jgi:hypothetical protein
MSIKLMSLIWEHATVGGSELLMLLALADYANDDGGSIYPSMQTLAKKSRLSVDQARRVIHKLINDGVIELVEEGGWKNGRNRSNEYRILPGGYLHPASTRTDARGGTRTHASTVLAPVQDDPSVNHQLETPLNNDDEKARQFGAVVKAWEGNIGVVAAHIGEQLKALIDEVGPLSVIHGIHVATEANVRNFKYVQKCAVNHANGVEKPQAKPQVNHRQAQPTTADLFAKYRQKKGFDNERDGEVQPASISVERSAYQVN